MAIVWFAKAVMPLRLKIWRGGEEREVAFVQYMEVRAPFDAVQNSVGCICVRWSTSD